MTLKVSLSCLLAAFILLQIGAVYCDGKHKSLMDENQKSSMDEKHKSMDEKHKSSMDEKHKSSMDEKHKSSMDEKHKSSMDEKHKLKSSMDERHKSTMDAADPCTAGEMRVSEGTFKDGFLDYCFDGEWGIVCGDNWDSDNAEVACRQLGFKPSANPSDTEYIERPDDTPKYLRLIDCGGTEAQLSDCSYLEGGTSNTGRWCNWSTYNSGMWKYQLAKVRCKEPLTCADPDAPDNGDVVIGGNDVGDTATYTCDTGYNLVGAAMATCNESADGESASFTPDPPVCEIIVTCDNPEKPENGGVTVTGNTIGSTATYTCNTGYELKGDDEATCTEAADGNSASFKPNPPVCKEILMCDTPDDPENGGVTVSGNDIGSTATYTCDTGYELKGDNEATCTEADDGNSASFKPAGPPVCEKIPVCNTLKEPKDGSVTITGNGIGDTATYTCNAGFELKGKDSRTCKKGKKGKDPKWKPRAPKCKEIKFKCAKPEIPDDGDVEYEGLLAGNTATYKCRRGFKPIGETTATCTVNDDGTSASFIPAEPPVCNITCDADAEGVVRLMGGPSKLEGRVEMCMNGEFGTICDQNWGEKEARIVCGEISRKRGSEPKMGGEYEEGTGPIHGTKFMCDGTEDRLYDCGYTKEVNSKKCTHATEAGAMCMARGQY